MNRVLLPEPMRPMKPTRSPGRIVRLRPFSTGAESRVAEVGVAEVDAARHARQVQAVGALVGGALHDLVEGLEGLAGLLVAHDQGGDLGGRGDRRAASIDTAISWPMVRPPAPIIRAPNITMGSR